jgi:hypothetical protein
MKKEKIHCDEERNGNGDSTLDIFARLCARVWPKADDAKPGAEHQQPHVDLRSTCGAKSMSRNRARSFRGACMCELVGGEASLESQFVTYAHGARMLKSL